MNAMSFIVLDFAASVVATCLMITGTALICWQFRKKAVHYTIGKQSPNMRTHYTYGRDDNGQTWVVDTLDLRAASVTTRRKLIAELMACGMGLARIPTHMVGLSASELTYELNRIFD
jgi:uncharacterized protein YigE (DUF2233 family)